MKKILITGASGYIGKNLVNQLLKEKNCKIIVVDRKDNHYDPKVTVIKRDIFDGFQNVWTELGKPDVCIHLAWQDGFKHNAPSHLENLPKHFRFLTSLIENGLKQLVVMGSMHEVGYICGEINEKTPCNPLTYYGIAKNALRQALTIFCQNHQQVKFQWLRGFYIYGDFSRGCSIFTKIYQLEQAGEKTFPFTSGENKYDFINMDTFVQQIAAVSLQTKITGIINCCSGIAIPLKNKIEAFLQENNFKIRPEYNVFPNRIYDSPEVYGNTEKITKILKQK